MINQKVGVWLNSKQDENSLRMLREYDEYFNSVDSLLKSRVSQYVKNNRTLIGKVLYKSRDCYVDDMSYHQFTQSVIKVANDNIKSEDTLSKIIQKSIDIILKQDTSLKKKYTREDIAKVIKCYAFYQPFVGYAFEQRIRDIIKSDSRFDIYRSSTLDNEYAIDMQIHDKITNKVIALQLKSQTFLNLNVNTRSNYYYKNRQAINHKFCEDVYYVFHNNSCDIVSNNFMQLTHYENACRDEEKYLVVEDEKYFIKELIEIFESR